MTQNQPPQQLTLSDLADLVDRLPGRQKIQKSDSSYTEPDQRVIHKNEPTLDAPPQILTTSAVTTMILSDSTRKNILLEAAHNVSVSESQTTLENPVEGDTENKQRAIPALTEEMKVWEKETAEIPGHCGTGTSDAGSRDSQTQPQEIQSETQIHDALDSAQNTPNSSDLLPQNQSIDEASSTPVDEPMPLADTVSTTAGLDNTNSALLSNSPLADSADIQSTEHAAMNSPQNGTEDTEISSAPAPPVETRKSLVNYEGDTPVAKRQRTHYDSISAAPNAPGPNAMTREQKKFCSAIIRNMKRLKEARLFLEPVDPVKYNIPDYPTIIKRPMDLSTVEKTLAAQQYNSSEEFADDVRLIFQNCYRFNGVDSAISASAKSLEDRFETQMKKLPPLIEIDVNPSHSTCAFSTPAPPHSLGRPKSAKSASSASSNHAGFSTPSTPAINARPRRETHPPPHHDFPLTSPSHAYHLINDPQLKFCHQVLREFTKKAHSSFAFAFLQPVDYVALNIPDYPRIIKKPMDISTIRRKLESGEYTSHIDFEEDVLLMFNNCYTYNAPGTPVHNWGKQLEMVFRNKWRELPTLVPQNVAKTPRARGSAAKGTAKRQRVHAEEDMEHSEESDDEHATQLAELEKHLLVMSQQLATMKSKKAKSDKKRKESSNPTAAGSKSTAAQGKRGSVSTGGAKKAPRKRKPKAKGEVGATEGSGRKKEASGANGEGEDLGNHTYTHNASTANTITHEEKFELSKLINELPESKLATVVEIIRESMPELRDSGEEIELDIDTLSPTTLTKLYRFVSGNVPGAKRGGRGSARGRGRGRGGANGAAAGEGEKEKDRKGKMTYLTEEEQSRKINELEMKLKQFAEVNGVAVPDAGTGQEGQQGSSSDSSGSDDSDSGDESSESLV